jgi:hypothetical protein
MALVNIEGMLDVTYHLNDHVKKRWDSIRGGRLKKMDNDKIYIVDGRERTGKSVFTLQQACYIDPTLINHPERICFSADEFLEAIRKTDSDLTTTRCIVFDEAFRGLSSRGAMSKVNKKIITALMEVGQKNLVIFIVLPSFFMLDLYPAMLRSNALFHIALDKKNKKRVFYIYPHKKKGELYQAGVRKGWSYNIFTKSKGYFYNKFPANSENEVVKAFYDKYLKKKRSSLVESEEETVEYVEEGKYKEMLKKRCWILLNRDGLSQRKAEKVLKEEGYDVSYVQIGIWANELQKKIELEAKKAVFMTEMTEKVLNGNG